MPDEEEIIEKDDVQEPEMDANMYLEKLKELKKDYVPKKDYEKVVADRKILADQLANDRELDDQNMEDQKVDTKELRKKLFSRDSNLNNLEFAEAMLQLRDEAIKQGETDPFLPIGEKVTITRNDIDAAQNVADVFKQCIEDADGDPDQFNLNLQRSIR